MKNRKLTVNSVKEIKPGVKDVIVWDSEIPGFGVKVTPTGKRSFLLYYRTLDHTQRKPIIGRFPELKPETARNIALDWLAQVRAGGDPSAERKARRATRGQDTVAQMLEGFLVAKSKLRSVGEIERIFRKDILPAIGNLRTDEVRRSDISRLLEKIEKRAPSVARQARAHLSSFYSWAMPRLSDAATDPVTGSVRISASEKRDRVLSDPEIKGLWTVLGTEANPWQTALKILLLTGQRRSEVLKADWSEFNLTAAEWVIPAERAKNGKANSVPLAPAVIELLESIPHQSGKLFKGTGQVSRHAKRIREKLEQHMNVPIEPWHWHDIRRTVATGMQKLGVRLEVTEAVLNHVSGSQSGITGIYQTYDWAEEKRQALELWSNRLDLIVRG